MMERAARLLRNQVCGLSAAFLFLCLLTGTAYAHDGQPPAPHDLWSAWNWDPWILSSMILLAWVYMAGQREQRQRAGSHRSELNWRAVSFAGGCIALLLALVSPLDTTGSALFSAHMIQHMLLIVIVPPLLIVGVSPGSFLLAFSSPVQRKLGRLWRRMSWLRFIWHALTQPPIAWMLNVLALWVWHAPRLYQAALENEAVHTLEHFSFLSTSLLFWWTILRPRARRGRGDPGILWLFTMALQGGLLGALSTFAPIPWYAAYASTTQPWGLSPLEDHQLAGAIMWIPVGTVYTLVALILFIIRLARIERTANQRELMSVKQSAPPKERPEYWQTNCSYQVYVSWHMYTSPQNRAIVWGIIAIAVLANIAGYVLDLYQRFWWLDDVLHAYTSFAITLPLALLLYGAVLSGAQTHSLLLILTIASLGVAIGVLWEVAEWGYDQLVPRNAILGKKDTIIDLIMDALGAITAGIVSIKMVD